MTDKPIYFKNFAEIEARPNFDPSCGITPETVVGLIGEYHCVADEERPCQRQKPDKHCGEDHRNGWLGRRADGKEALIGWNCGLEHFKASAVFARERNRVTREFTLDGLITRLTSTAGSDEYRAEARDLLGRARSLRTRIQDIRERFPWNVQARLYAMAREGQTALFVEHRYEKLSDDSEDAELIPDWTRSQAAVLAGMGLWGDDELRVALADLHSIRDTLEVVQLDRNLGPRKLRPWADTLDKLKACKAIVESLSNDSTAFLEAVNVRWVCLATNNFDESVEVAAIALELAGQPSTRMAAERMYRALAKEIRARGGERDFRAVW